MYNNSRKKSDILIMGLLTLLLLISLFIPEMNAQDEQATPIPDPEMQKRISEANTRMKEAEAALKEAELKEKELGLEKARAEAREAELKNRESEVKLLKGAATVEGELIETKIIGYKGLACTAKRIRDSINARNEIRRLLVYDDQIAIALTQYLVTVKELEALGKSYKTEFKLPVAQRLLDPVNPQGIKPSGQLRLAAPIPSLVIDYLSLFQATSEIKSTPVQATEEEFLSTLNKGIKAELYFPEKIVPLDISNSRIINELDKVNEEFARAGYLINVMGLEIFAAREEIETLEEKKSGIESEINKLDQVSDSEKIAELKDDLEIVEADIDRNKELARQLREISIRLEILNGILGNIMARLFAASGNEDEERTKAPVSSSLADLLKAEITRGILMSNGNDGGNYWLDVKVISTIGTTKNKSMPIVDIFTGGQRLSFSGGAIISYRVFDSNGRVILSETESEYVPFRKSRKIRSYDCK